MTSIKRHLFKRLENYFLTFVLELQEKHALPFIAKETVANDVAFTIK